MKKQYFLLLILIIIAAVIVGWYYWSVDKQSSDQQSVDLTEDIFDLDLIDSPLKQVVVPDVDVDLANDFGKFDFELSDIPSIDTSVTITPPSIDL